MTFLQKKLWLAWSKFRFLRLPIEKRVRLEISEDGRHLTFLLTALGEAGYGVYVVNSPWVFRELICLRKAVPLPFVIGGKERECGLPISDREHSSLVTRNPSHILLDYDYFSGLTSAGVSHEGRENFNHGLHNRAPGQARDGATEGRPEGRGSGNERVKYSRIESEEEAGLRLASQAGAAFPNPSTSELARDSENTSPIRSADGPASTPATSHPPLATAPQALRMPYFMHPSVYHRGLHKGGCGAADNGGLIADGGGVALDSGHTPLATSYPPQRRRRFRIGFFGTHDREFYTKHYHFPGMNRFEILEIFLNKFGDRMKPLRGFPRDWDPCEIVVSIDGRGGDRQGKSFLSQENYFAALRECDFVLSPPGWCMPVSHNLIETMFCGAIPITNGGAFMSEPLKDWENCLEFSGEADFVAAIEKALSMSDQGIEKMRGAVWDYYRRFLDPIAFGKLLGKDGYGRLLVNAEEKSVPWGRDFYTEVDAFMAKYC